ncbi:peptidoglycan-binding protein [Eubacteriales bacterium]|nr:hypothetical protein [Faecalicatena sp. BF-R-105]GKH50570.1 peptidoglycan-binding protein [Eubacteriales bacterium]GKH63292.1 peptidoglycan-binding protein [Eubacteriales bacterium]
MAFGASLKGAVQSVKEKTADYLTPAKLEKAKLYLVKSVDETGTSVKLGDSIQVQFNPAQYQITRNMRISKMRAVGRDPGLTQLQSVCGEFATLNVTLYFDTITNLNSLQTSDLAGLLQKGGLSALMGKAKSAVKAQLGASDKRNPTESGKDIAKLLRYNDEQHTPLKVRFLWGTLDFVGYVANSVISYTMFAPDGTPIRAKVDLSISGEETSVFQGKHQLTFSSPDRTKERMLTEGDQLWMLAQQEYDDPAQWRAIAAANGILNPRQLAGARALKLPPIK